jgi:hypothetical protein
MDPVSALRLDYASAFAGYLSRRDEMGLRAAYELGRRAMSDPVGLLRLVHVHHEVLVDVLRGAHGADDVQDIGDAAAAFLAEALASFQMIQRGYLEKARNPAGASTTMGRRDSSVHE